MLSAFRHIEHRISRKISIAPLVTFRVLFGALMFASVVRFMAKGWIEQLYLEPEFFFTYLGFSWVKPLGPAGMYAVFILMGLAALGIMAGWRYRWSVLVFFVAFNYVELLDKTNYLNHYYFVSLVAFLLIFLPANRRYSVDVLRRPETRCDTVPWWTVGILQLQLGLVYFYAGVAKLNPYWLFEAMPLKIWLPAHSDLPLIGPLLAESWTAYAFSWGGALYDLSIPFLLLIPFTRGAAYILVIGFHVMTRILFPIGMFPYIMIASTLIFFSPEFHDRIWQRLSKFAGRKAALPRPFAPAWESPLRYRKALSFVLVLFVTCQLLLPWRFALYPGNLFWTEEGYRFSWRVMLMEKAGYASFTVTDPLSGRSSAVDAGQYLCAHQEKMMATQPDMILQFAHYLEDRYREDGYGDVEVRTEAYVTLNGRRSQLLIDPERDLTRLKYNLAHRDWVLPFNDRP